MVVDIYFILLLIGFFIAAFMYSSVGHGGASGYLAIMALAGFAPDKMKISALILNLIVSIIAFVYYYRAGHFKWRLFYPFALTSIPFAYIGSYIGVDAYWYKKILAACLVIACIRLFGMITPEDEKPVRKVQFIPALIAGVGIGIVSGMIGIGGGILLSPLLLFMNGGNLREIAAVSALFIFVNSFSALLGDVSSISRSNIMIPVIVVAFLGALAGARWGSKFADNRKLKIALGLVMLFASFKLLTV